METHTSSFASIFFCFFDFRLFTFTHCASTGSSSEGAISDPETRGDVFCFFEGTDEDEEGRFMAVTLWEIIGRSRAPNTRPLSHQHRIYTLHDDGRGTHTLPL
jgi:hypothetical protein